MKEPGTHIILGQTYLDWGTRAPSEGGYSALVVCSQNPKKEFAVYQNRVVPCPVCGVNVRLVRHIYIQRID